MRRNNANKPERRLEAAKTLAVLYTPIQKANAAKSLASPIPIGISLSKALKLKRKRRYTRQMHNAPLMSRRQKNPAAAIRAGQRSGISMVLISL
jgi:hypothetical protein